MHAQASTRVICAVVSPLDNPALKDLPSTPEVEFIIANDMTEFIAHPNLQQAKALLWIPPGSSGTLHELASGGHLPKLEWARMLCQGSNAEIAEPER